jgi:cell division transport system permease protein
MRYLIEEAFANIRHGGFVSFLSIVIIALTATITSALILIGNYLHREVENLKDEPTVIAFLKDTLNESEGRELRTRMEKIDHVDSVVYVSKTEALERSEKAFGELGELITQGFEEINPLPASLEIYIKKTSLDRARLEQLAHSVKTFPGIEDVSYEQYSSEFIHRTELVIMGLGGLMGLASVIIVCFSIMLTAYFRREEIRVMKLVGATYWYIRIPLIAQGVFLGFMGSLSGVVGFYGLFRLFTPQIGEAAFIPPSQLVMVLLGGVLLGLVGGLLPLRRYVNV